MKDKNLYFIGYRRSPKGAPNGYFIFDEDYNSIHMLNVTDTKRHIEECGITGLGIEAGKIVGTTGSIQRYMGIRKEEYSSDRPKIVILGKLLKGDRTVGYKVIRVNFSVLRDVLREGLGKGLPTVLSEDAVIKYEKDISNGKVVRHDGVARIYSLQGPFREYKLGQSVDEMLRRKEPWGINEFAYVIHKMGGHMELEESEKRVIKVHVPKNGLNIHALRLPVVSRARQSLTILFSGGDLRVQHLKIEQNGVEVNAELCTGSLFENVVISGAEDIRNITIEANVGTLSFGEEANCVRNVEIAGKTKLIKFHKGITLIEDVMKDARCEIQAVDFSELTDKCDIHSFQYSNEYEGEAVKVKLGNVLKYMDCFMSAPVELYGEFGAALKDIRGFANITNRKVIDFSSCSVLKNIVGIDGRSIREVILPKVDLLTVNNAFVLAPIEEIKVNNKLVCFEDGSFTSTGRVEAGNNILVERYEEGYGLNLFIRNEGGTAFFPVFRGGTHGVRIEVEEGVGRLKRYSKMSSENSPGSVLEKVNLPSSLKYIEDEVFKNVGYIDINMENTKVETLERGTFEGSTIRFMALPKTLRRIEDGAFTDKLCTAMYFPDSLEYMAKDGYRGVLALVHKGSLADRMITRPAKVYVNSVDEAIKYIKKDTMGEKEMLAVSMITASGSDIDQWLSSPRFKENIRLLSKLKENTETPEIKTEGVDILYPERLINFSLKRLGLVGEVIEDIVIKGKTSVKKEGEGLTNTYKAILNFIMANSEIYAGMFTSKVLEMFGSSYNEIMDSLSREHFMEDAGKYVMYKDSDSAILALPLRVGVPRRLAKYAEFIYALVAIEHGSIRYVTAVDNTELFNDIETLNLSYVNMTPYLVRGDVVSFNARTCTVELKEIPYGLAENIMIDLTRTTVIVGNFLYCFNTGKVLSLNESKGGTYTILDIRDFKDCPNKVKEAFRLRNTKAIKYLDRLNGKDADLGPIMPKKQILGELFHKVDSGEMTCDEMEDYLMKHETQYKVKVKLGILYRKGYNSSLAKHGSLERVNRGKLHNALMDRMYVIVPSKNFTKGWWRSDEQVSGTISRFNIPKYINKCNNRKGLARTKILLTPGQRVTERIYNLDTTYDLIDEWKYELIEDGDTKISMALIFGVSRYDGLVHMFYSIDKSSYEGYTSEIRYVGKVTDFERLSIILKESLEDGNYSADACCMVLRKDPSIYEAIRDVQEGKVSVGMRPDYSILISELFELLGL